MCGSSPKAPPPPAQAVPLPPEAAKPAVVETDATKLKKPGRSTLTIPTGSASATGLSGLNIPA